MNEKIKYSLIGVLMIFGLVRLSFLLAQGMAQNSGSDEPRTIENSSYLGESPQFIQDEPAEILKKMVNKTPGIYYFGFPDCPWCQGLVPVFQSVLADEGKQSWVVNIRDKSYTSTDRRQLASFFKEHRSEPEVAVPFVVAISKSGSVVTHVGTVPTHHATQAPLTKEEESQLRQLLTTVVRHGN